MRRRNFIQGVAASTAWSLGARAQHPTMPVIGYLAVLRSGTDAHIRAAFLQGLREAGYVEGGNVTIEFRSAEGNFNRLPGMAVDLVSQRVTVIVAVANAAATAAKNATAKIPIVFIGGGDPVDSGLVNSLNRPGGNVTGIAFLINVIAAKRLQLARELVPKATAIALLVNPNNPNAGPETRNVQEVADNLGLQLHVLNAGSEPDLDMAIAASEQQRAGALLVAADAFFTGQRDQIVSLAARHKLPTVYPLREFAVAGGLLSYGASFIDAAHLAGGYVGRMLNGEKPSDLPVQQSTKLELVINLKTAKALGLTIPPTLLATADEVIE